MIESLASRRFAALVLVAVVTSTCVLAQPAKQYQPKEYQDGKDVVWVPTAQTLVDRMLDIANVTAADTVIDLGSGDGRTVITAAKRGAKALGVEYNPKMVELSKDNAAKEGVADKVTFVKADLFKTDFSQATVLTMFLLPEINLKLRPKILAMKPGTRVVSNSFDMGDWKADQTIDPVEKCKDYCNAFLWIVPAKVAGTWKTPDGRLELKQNFQFFTGRLVSGNVVTPVKGGRITADAITFTAGNATVQRPRGGQRDRGQQQDRRQGSTLEGHARQELESFRIILDGTSLRSRVILGLVPRIHLSTRDGARRWLDGRDRPDHDRRGIRFNNRRLLRRLWLSWIPVTSAGMTARDMLTTGAAQLIAARGLIDACKEDWYPEAAGAMEGPMGRQITRTCRRSLPGSCCHWLLAVGCDFACRRARPASRSPSTPTWPSRSAPTPPSYKVMPFASSCC